MVLLSESFARVIGCDLSEEAVRFSTTRGFKQLLVADINCLQLRSASFDCVVCSDVFESFEVDERCAIDELSRVTKPGGARRPERRGIPVPAQRARSRRPLGRRYTKARARATFATAGIRITRMRYLFGALFLPIVTYRVIRRFVRRRPVTPRSDLVRPPRILDSWLYGIVRLERTVSRLIPMPFGTTLLVELERV
jgi:SAM-dependent methyltransferase